MLRAVLPAVLMAAPLAAQPGVLTRELLIEYTPEWKGERFPDGRPKVPDAILKRMRTVTLEEAWAVVKGRRNGETGTRPAIPRRRLRP